MNLIPLLVSMSNLFLRKLMLIWTIHSLLEQSFLFSRDTLQNLHNWPIYTIYTNLAGILELI